jgi:Putative zinc-finger
MNKHFEFEDAESNHRREPIDPKAGQPEGSQLTAPCCSVSQRDRFELLSAYLDGEVTASERRQVEEWLATDAKTQCLYSRLLTLRQGLQALPIVQAEPSLDHLVDQVTARLDRNPRRWLWGGFAAAALLAGALLTALPQQRYAPSVATAPDLNEEVPSDGLMIALNHPPIEIPDAVSDTPISTPRKSTPATLR